MNHPKQSAGLRPCRVETYSGARLHEHPRRFTYQGEWLEVVQILHRWREPEHLGFLVVASDSRRYCLNYQLHRDSWEVMIWRGSAPQTP
jgi:hypothetical protein